jgi:hypothetical protein
MKSTHAAIDHPTEGKAEHDAPEPQQDPAKPQLGIRFWLAFWAIAFTNLAAAFDATTLSVALPVRPPATLTHCNPLCFLTTNPPYMI